MTSSADQYSLLVLRDTKFQRKKYRGDVGALGSPPVLYVERITGDIRDVFYGSSVKKIYDVDVCRLSTSSLRIFWRIAILATLPNTPLRSTTTIPLGQCPIATAKTSLICKCLPNVESGIQRVLSRCCGNLVKIMRCITSQMQEIVELGAQILHCRHFPSFGKKPTSSPFLNFEVFLPTKSH